MLSGTLWMVLDDRDLYVPEGKAAEFTTQTPHGFGGYQGPAEVLMIFDRGGERAARSGLSPKRRRRHISVRSSTSGRGPMWLMTSAAAIEPSRPHSGSDRPFV